MLQLGRKKLGKIIRIITGHNELNYHRNNVDSNIEKDCRFCLEDDITAWHVMNECPVFSNTWRNILLGKNLVADEWKVETLVKLFSIKAIDAALEGWEFEHDDWREMEWTTGGL